MTDKAFAKYIKDMRAYTKRIAKDPVACRKFLVDAGIYDGNGQLTEPYRSVRVHSEAEVAVDAITADLPLILGSTNSNISFKYCSGYNTEWVTYLGFSIWSNDDDCREWDESVQQYEPLEPYLRRRINAINASLGKLKLKVVS